MSVFGSIATHTPLTIGKRILIMLHYDRVRLTGQTTIDTDALYEPPTVKHEQPHIAIIDGHKKQWVEL